jgi:hypothetical protein
MADKRSAPDTGGQWRRVRWRRRSSLLRLSSRYTFRGGRDGRKHRVTHGLMVVVCGRSVELVVDTLATFCA